MSYTAFQVRDMSELLISRAKSGSANDARGLSASIRSYRLASERRKMVHFHTDDVQKCTVASVSAQDIESNLARARAWLAELAWVLTPARLRTRAGQHGAVIDLLMGG